MSFIYEVNPELRNITTEVSPKAPKNILAYKKDRCIKAAASTTFNIELEIIYNTFYV